MSFLELAACSSKIAFCSYPLPEIGEKSFSFFQLKCHLGWLVLEKIFNVRVYRMDIIMRKVSERNVATPCGSPHQDFRAVGQHDAPIGAPHE